jgi:DNA-binding NarL/FixJ family response regulator
VRHPQLLIYRGDERLATVLEPRAAAERWTLRKPRDAAECLEALPRAAPAVLVLRVGRDLEDELTALSTVHQNYPDASIIVTGDSEQSALAGIAWDLGARFVLFPPLSRDLLPDVVAGFMCPETGELT